MWVLVYQSKWYHIRKDNNLNINFNENVKSHVGYEVLTAVVVKSCVFWKIMWCSPLKVKDVSEEHFAAIFSVKEQAKLSSAFHLLHVSFLLGVLRSVR
jgi:hypothetical protein